MYALEKMVQIDRTKIELHYTDGVVKQLLVSIIQQNCPCKKCGLQREKNFEDVSALHAQTIGRYGIKFQFARGCSQGIYPHQLLREIV